MEEQKAIEEAIRILSVNDLAKKRYAATIDSLNTRLQRSLSNVYRLGVIGVTSSGKSTMINALLGESLLPSGARPTSSQLVSCHKGATKKLNVVFENNQIKNFLNFTPKMIAQYGDERINQNNKEKVKQLEIITPSFPLDKSIILVDSPGLDAYGYESHEELTMNSLLPTVDFCLFVTTCKSNSDDKMLSVLNTIAEYGKPVIIIQNMIDSIKPSPDGQKTPQMLAQEYKNRIGKVIARSRISDKSKVCVVQISAVWALDARRNGNRKKLADSNIELLISQIDKYFHMLKPNISGQRMSLLKKELMRIANETLEDAKRENSKPILSKFEFEGVEDELLDKLNDANDAIKNVMTDFKKFCRNTIQNYDIKTGFDLLNAKSERCKDTFLKQVKIVNNYITSTCKKLNIDTRDVFSRIQVESINLAPSTKVENLTRTVTHHRWEDSNLGLKRWLGSTWLFDEPWTSQEIYGTRTVVDRDKSQQEGKKKIEAFIKAMDKSFNDWTNNLDEVIDKLSTEIESRRKDWKERMAYAQKALKFKDIGEQLSQLADSIIVKNTKSLFKQQTTDYKQQALSLITTSRRTYAIYKLSKQIADGIHRKTISLFTNSNQRQNVIIGWDTSSEVMFTTLEFGCTIKEDKILHGSTRLTSNIMLCHNCNRPQTFKKPTNVFLLVDALQIGLAKNQIAALDLDSSLKTTDRLYLVIQDLQTEINGSDLEETMENMHSITKELHIRHHYSILANHINPIYNLALVAATERHSNTHADEVAVLGQLQKKFHYLFPEGKAEQTEMTKNIEKLINKTYNHG